MRENHYAISCIVLKIPHVFNKQDEYNSSYFSKCQGQTILSDYKINKKSISQPYYHTKLLSCIQIITYHLFRDADSSASKHKTACQNHG